MALTIFEKADSRQQTVGPDDPEITLLYGVVGSEDDGEIRKAVEGQIPAYFNGLPYQNYRLSPQGGGAWDVEVRYARQHQTGPGSTTGDGQTDGTGGGGDSDNKTHGNKGEPASEKSWSFQFDTMGGQQTFMYGRETKAAYVFDPLRRIDFKGGINVGPDGEAKGIEVHVPFFAFTLTASITPPLRRTWLADLADVTGKTNSHRVTLYVRGTEITFKPGELLCEGTTGLVRNDGDWELSARFMKGQHGEGIVIEGVDGNIIVEEKRAWDVLWIYCVKEKDEEGNIIRDGPQQVNVERVYDEFDFNKVLAPKKAATAS